MGGIGDNYQAITLDSLFGDNKAAGAPTTLYVALSTASVDFDGSGLNEPDTGDGYGRVSVTNNSTNFPAAADIGGQMAKTLVTAAVFPTPTDAWGNTLYWALMDSVTVGAGDVVTFGRFGGQSKNIETGDTITVPANTLTIYYREDV